MDRNLRPGWAARASTVCALSLVALGARPAQPGVAFVDGSLDAGIDVVHRNGATGELLLPEITGAGGALFDYDNDGDLDLYVVQGAELIPGRGDGAVGGGSGRSAARPALSQRSGDGRRGPAALY